MNLFALARVQTNNSHFQQKWGNLQSLFKLLGINIFSIGSDDDVFFSAGYKYKALFIHSAHVTRVKPTLLNNFGCGLWIIKISLKNAGARNTDLSLFIFIWTINTKS